ncbi:armadillo-type protein [Boletus edulis BED1]|uniref:Armadillo-type protein n=1 Tax=Boletus edulis BED1 TaxID=1328754 RepID=A0AAD4C2F5_BOLED|nr:armadillo-type protein [Boletus edulis BED1]
MTVRQITTASLKQLKNTVIGNPSAKLALARDTAFIHSLVDCLNHPPTSGEPQSSQDDIRIMAAHVISSISYGSETALASLLRANALKAIIRALSNPQALTVTSLKSALARALRVLASAIIEVAGPTPGPIRIYSAQFRSDAKIALSYLFELDCLDVYLPLLADLSAQTSVSIAQLIGAAVRTEVHRSAVIEWFPRLEPQREVKSRRGWERTGVVHVTTRHGAWVIRTLITMIQKKDLKVQEAALSALAALALDNPPVAIALARVPTDGTPSPLASVLSLTKIRITDVQLAASLCVTNIIRAQASNHPGTVDPAAALTVIQVLNRILLSPSESPQNQTKACRALSRKALKEAFSVALLVRDEKDLCLEVYDRGVLANVTSLVKSITPLDKPSDWDIDESESRVILREAALMTIASIALFDRVIKRDLADNIQLIPLLRACLAQKSVGVRVAACQCIRALSRDAAIIRTNLTDSGAGLALYQVFKKEDEDPRVIFAALAVVCNLVNDFSPLRPVMLADGLLPRLMRLFNVEDQEIRMGALWGLKNLLCKSSLATKQMVMTHLGWTHLAELVNDVDPQIQEQALCILRNLVEDEEGIVLIFDSMGEGLVAACISAGLDSSNEPVTRETAYFLGNLSNGTREQQDIIFTHPPILDLVHSCMADGKSGIRSPLVQCVFNLLTSNPRRRQELVDAGFVSTLRHLCDWTGTDVSVSPGGLGSAGRLGGGSLGVGLGVGVGTGMGTVRHQINSEDDKDAAEWARRVLDLMDTSVIGHIL